MKKILGFCTFMLLMVMQAQTYVITYTQSMDIKALEDSLAKNPRMQKFLSEDMKKSMIESLTKPQQYTLTYSEGKSLYKIVEEKVEEKTEDDELKVGQKPSFNFRRMMKRFSPVRFKNHETMEMISQQGIMDKQFLVVDSIKTLEWQFTDNVRKVGEMSCKEVVTTNNRKEKVTACYTEDIPINEGPEDYFGLPGLVVDVQIGPMNYAATEIKILKENTVLEAPKEGEKTSKADFDKMVKERMENMNRDGNGRGMNIIRM